MIAFLVLIVQASDVLQYIWGKLLGRRKFLPTLSPSKKVGYYPQRSVARRLSRTTPARADE